MRYFPSIGGVQTHVKEISERLALRGFDVEVLTTDPLGILPDQEIINNVVVRRFKSWAPGEAYYFSKDIKNYLSENSNNYSIVHAHGYQNFVSLYAAMGKKFNKFVFTPHFHRERTHLISLNHINY